jgi:hypothetical protein
MMKKYNLYIKMILKAVLPEDGQDDFTNDVKKCYINLKI